MNTHQHLAPDLEEDENNIQELTMYQQGSSGMAYEDDEQSSTPVTWPVHQQGNLVPLMNTDRNFISPSEHHEHTFEEIAMDPQSLSAMDPDEASAFATYLLNNPEALEVFSSLSATTYSIRHGSLIDQAAMNYLPTPYMTYGCTPAIEVAAFSTRHNPVGLAPFGQTIEVMATRIPEEAFDLPSQQTYAFEATLNEESSYHVSLMDLPIEIITMIVDLAFEGAHSSNSNALFYHPGPQVVVVTSASDYQNQPPYLAELKSPTSLPVSILACNRALHNIGKARFALLLGQKTFHFTSLDVFWSLHHRHPQAARSIGKVDVTAYRHMVFAGMALLLRYPLEEIALRTACPGLDRSRYDRDLSYKISDHLDVMFAGLPAKATVTWGLSPIGGAVVEPGEDPHTWGISHAESIVGDAIGQAFNSDSRWSEPWCSQLPSDGFLGTMATRGAFDHAAFAEKSPRFLPHAVDEMFLMDLKFDLLKEHFLEEVHMMQYLIALWKAMDEQEEKSMLEEV